MKHGYITLRGVITDPKKALDKMLQAYFHADTTKHGIDLQTRSLRSDMVDGSDIAGNIENSLKFILGCYFDVCRVTATNNGRDGNVQHIELEIMVIDEGRTIAAEHLLNIDGGVLKSITQVGHL